MSPAYETVVHSDNVGTNPVFFALSADGTRLYAANNGSSTVTVLDESAYP